LQNNKLEVGESPPAGQHHPANNNLRGYLLIAGATLFWGASASLGKAGLLGAVAGGSGNISRLDPLILAQSRTALSLLILAPLLLSLRGKCGLMLPRRDIFRCMWLGVVGLAGSNFMYYYAIEKTSVATAIVLQYTAPVWVLLYMLARKLQRPTIARIIAVIMAVIGIALAVGAVGLHATGIPIPFLQPDFKVNVPGLVAAQLAALSFAFYNIYGRSLLDAYDRWKVLLYALVGVTIFWLVINPPWKVFAAHYTWRQWTFMLVFAMSSMLLPFSLYFSGLRYLDPTRAIVTSCLEPIFAICFAATFVNEVLTGVQVLGVVVVLAGTVIVQLPEKRKAPAME
jgi:drug/metabolite transporter (DMT)-like permease